MLKKISSLIVPVVLLLSSCSSHEIIEPRLSEVSVSRILDKETRTEQIEGSIDGATINSKVTFRPISNSERAEDIDWLGTDGGIPEFVVSNISVTKNSKTLHIPTSEYEYFGEIFIQSPFLHLYDTDEGFALKYYGSDGAGSYNATFYFTGERFSKASVSTYLDNLNPPVYIDPPVQN